MKIDQVPGLDEMDKMLTTAITDDEVILISDIAKLSTKSGERFSTGFKPIDEVMKGGFKEGDLVVISGQSGEGKTTFAQTLTYHLTKQGIPCLWFSYEVSIEEIDIKFKEMGIDDHYFAYSPKKNTTGALEWLEYKIRESWIKYATKVVFIDHIDFLVPRNLQSGNREEMLKTIAIQLKTLAIEHRIIIVLLCHLKKMNDRNAEPEMVDIGYSAGIFQNADYVFLSLREKVKSRGLKGIVEDIASNITKIKIVKNRQTGRLIYLKLIYANGKYNLIANRQAGPDVSWGDEDISQPGG